MRVSSIQIVIGLVALYGGVNESAADGDAEDGGKVGDKDPFKMMEFYVLDH